ncbi:phage prohead protease, HK97 family [Bradyrhizobium brasilense]|uniref:Phage prohead protease, HK97 family n=1 Tax=Bradyrhizobium brasilense TaxID=1419277 RepID=A0A1G7AE06_9BRAD|nr:HK97 family phage prohead protease [Bradyrhizobium brasilense]SDE12255.1 phage prohead protease, HK97 family [Bradyrhizobium brasilense]
MNHLIAIDTSAHERMLKKYARYFKGRSKPATAEREEDEPRLCVEGLAVLLNEPIGTKTGDIIVFEDGAFDAHFSSSSRTEMWLAHDPTEVICSTNSGLEFANTEKGLAFRFPLDNKRYADTVKRMITSGKQAAVSVGVTRTKERAEMVGRHRVIFIESAELREVSLVAAGACESAFARLVDANHSPSLKDSVKSNPFKIDSGLHNIKTQREKNATRIDALMERLDTLDGGTPGPRYSLGSHAVGCQARQDVWSLAASNRRQTEETERLVAHARLLHCA